MAAIAKLTGKPAVGVSPMSSSQREAAHFDGLTLEGLDEDAFESLVANGFDSRKVPSALRGRAAELEALMGVLDTPVVSINDGQEALVASTMAAIANAESISQRRRTIHAASRRELSGPIGLRVGNAAAIAASVLIAGSVAWPVMAALRDKSRQVACAGNFGAVGSAVNAYAGNNNSFLPMAYAGFGGGGGISNNSWWDVGKEGQSNSQHIFKLAVEKYVTVEQLACPGNDRGCTSMLVGGKDWQYFDDVSYSMQLMCEVSAKQWKQTPDKPLMADRNAAVVKAWHGQPMDPLENSRNHNSKGQWILRYDGSAVWNADASVGGDMIWVPRTYETMMKTAVNPRRMAPLTGRERPSAAGEVFLTP